MDIAIAKPQQALAWRIDFVEGVPLGEAEPAIRQPRTTWTQVYELDAPTVLFDTRAPEPTSSGVTLVYLPSGAATPYEIQNRAESWMASRPGEDSGTLEIEFRSERLLWRRGRAVCFGSLQARDHVIDAVTHFSFCEIELVRLEQQVEAFWPTLEDHMRLMEPLSSRDLKRHRDIDTMARMATAMRVAHVRLQAALERPPSVLAAPARRLFLELNLQADTAHRLEMLDDAIEVIDEFYKHMREQFAEFRYFLSEYRVEILIVVVLIAELAEILISIARLD